MRETPNSVGIAIRPAISQDADGIARVFLESAEYHARLDPERYLVPAIETIAARYRKRRRSPRAEKPSITLVADLGGEIVGFVDVRLQRSPDPMHREMIYCHIVEIAVNLAHQNQGIGRRLLRAAEDWGQGLGATLASLEYHAANTRASYFYEQCMGYRTAAVIAIKPL